MLRDAVQSTGLCVVTSCDLLHCVRWCRI